MPASPSPLNYYLGKGILLWKGPLDADFRDLGNAPSFSTTPKITTLPHYSARLGTKFKDFEVNDQIELSLKFVLEEWTAENLALVMMGSTNLDGTINMMDLGQVIGAIRFVGTNNVGQKQQVDIPTVNIQPASAIDWIGDKWGMLEVSGEVIGDPITGSFGLIHPNISAEVTG